MTPQQLDTVRTQITAVANALADMVTLCDKTRRRPDEAEFANKYMQKRALLVAAVNDLPSVS